MLSYVKIDVIDVTNFQFHKPKVSYVNDKNNLLCIIIFITVTVTVTVVNVVTVIYSLRLRLSNRIGMKFGRNVLHVNTHRLSGRIFDLTSDFQDDDHDVISCRKVLPPGE